MLYLLSPTYSISASPKSSQLIHCKLILYFPTRILKEVAYTSVDGCASSAKVVVSLQVVVPIADDSPTASSSIASCGISVQPSVILPLASLSLADCWQLTR